jgi:hypothetical protein
MTLLIIKKHTIINVIRKVMVREVLIRSVVVPNIEITSVVKFFQQVV